MESSVSDSNESRASKAFSKQSGIFDAIYAANTIVNYKRERVRNHLQGLLGVQSNILELNSGTGEDAIWLAQQGHRVHATDISSGMQEILKNKVSAAGLQSRISNELCSFTQLSSLKEKGPYDLIFSNFAGLNCSGDLDKVLQSFESLLKPGGLITLVILPRFCLWESLLLFKGKLKTATRRFSTHGVPAKVEGEAFTCWYYNPSFVIKNLEAEYHVVSIEGLCTIVPPSYIEHFAEKHPALYGWLKKKEVQYGRRWPWRSIGDYYIITLRKKR